MIETILFDLDDTLFDFSLSEKYALMHALDTMEITYDETLLKEYSMINSTMWKKLERKEVTRKSMKIERFKILFDTFNINKDYELCATLYEHNLGIGHYYKENSEEVIQRLSKKYRLFIVSNGTGSVQRGRIKDSYIETYFEDIFISEEIGFNKPDIRFFDYCFEHIKNFNKDRCILIGDSLTSDIAGGKNANIKTIWLHTKNEESTLSDYEIHSLLEIESVLEGIE